MLKVLVFFFFFAKAFFSFTHKVCDSWLGYSSRPQLTRRRQSKKARERERESACVCVSMCVCVLGYTYTKQSCGMCLVHPV